MLTRCDLNESKYEKISKIVPGILKVTSAFGVSKGFQWNDFSELLAKTTFSTTKLVEPAL